MVRPVKILRLYCKEAVVQDGLETKIEETSPAITSATKTNDRDFRKLLSGIENILKGIDLRWMKQKYLKQQTKGKHQTPSRPL